MRRVSTLGIYVLSLVIILCTACDTKANYSTEGVIIQTELKCLDAGFCEVSFKPSHDTWYFIAMEEVKANYNPQESKKHFMTLSIDNAYRKYIDWRYNKLVHNDSFIADFASHALQYSNTDYVFTYLKPDTDYWLYSFVVDPTTNEPVGNLNIMTVRTKSASEIEIKYEYRISGNWDYVYPRDAYNNINNSIPWVAETVDSLYLDKIGVATPEEYFTSRFNKMYLDKTAIIHYGIYAHNNDGVGDGSSNTIFEPEHTYYKAVATFNGDPTDFVIYRFKWTGPETELLFKSL